jgi:endo-1,4-beta-xylanase
MLTRAVFYHWWPSCAVVSAVVFGLSAPASGTVSTITYSSPSNNRNLSFQVYTPPGYTTDPSREYPVVISLHGIGGTSLQRANLYGPTLDAKINSAEILPMIWIFPDGQTNAFYGDAFDGHKQVYSQIINEELPYVDAHYRTIADRDHRAMEGFSMGGFGAAMYAAKHTELFSAVVEYGGALSTWDNLVQFNNAVAVEMYNSNKSNFLPYSLWDVTDANAAAIKSQLNYKMIVGDADSQYQSNTRFRDHLIGLGIDPHFQVLLGVEHVAGSYLTDGSGLRFLSDHFSSTFRHEGDYDRNGLIDSNDYSSWKKTFGSSTQLSADGNENGIVDGADYVIWRRQMVATASGASVGSAAVSGSIPVPESAALALTAFAAAFCLSQRVRICSCH